ERQADVVQFIRELVGLRRVVEQDLHPDRLTVDEERNDLNVQDDRLTGIAGPGDAAFDDRPPLEICSVDPRAELKRSVGKLELVKRLPQLGVVEMKERARPLVDVHERAAALEHDLRDRCVLKRRLAEAAARRLTSGDLMIEQQWPLFAVSHLPKDPPLQLD